MSEHLDKARAALVEAKDLEPNTARYLYLMEIVRVQAALAQAAAMERIAEVLEDVHNANEGTVRTEAI